MKLTINNKVSVQAAPVSFQKALKKRLTIQNPKWIENDRMGRWNGGTPEHLHFYENQKNGGLIAPRGFIRQLISMASKYDVPYRIEDQRRILPEIDLIFHGKSRAFQEKAVTDILSRDFGTLSAATGSGKTVMALAVIAERKQPALIVVHTKELLNQWIDRIVSFLNIPKDEIGIIGAVLACQALNEATTVEVADLRRQKAIHIQFLEDAPLVLEKLEAREAPIHSRMREAERTLNQFDRYQTLKRQIEAGHGTYATENDLKDYAKTLDLEADCKTFLAKFGKR